MPAAVSYTGFYAKHQGPVRFAGGSVKLDGVSVRNEEGVNYPVTADELYISFALVSVDGEPIAKARRLTMSCVSSSFNYGMKLDEAIVARGDLGYTGKPFEKMIKGGDTMGKPPVAYCIPGATITAAVLAGLQYRLLDFHFREVGRGTVGPDGIFTIDDDRPVFAIDFIRP